MLIGGKECKTGQRIKVINAKSILHYKYGMTGDCNKDMTGITGVITAESTYDEYAAVDHSLPPYVRWILRQVRKNGEQNPEQNTTRYTYTKSEKGKIVKCSRQYLRHIALMS